MNYEINNLKIIVKNEVIDNIKKFYWSNLKYETGGILLGKFNRKNKLIEISEVYELKTSLFSKILYNFCHVIIKISGSSKVTIPQ